MRTLSTVLFLAFFVTFSNSGEDLDARGKAALRVMAFSSDDKAESIVAKSRSLMLLIAMDDTFKALRTETGNFPGNRCRTTADLEQVYKQMQAIDASKTVELWERAAIFYLHRLFQVSRAKIAEIDIPEQFEAILNRYPDLKKEYRNTGFKAMTEEEKGMQAIAANGREWSASRRAK